jgi:hypothetical protein
MSVPRPVYFTCTETRSCSIARSLRQPFGSLAEHASVRTRLKLGALVGQRFQKTEAINEQRNTARQ